MKHTILLLLLTLCLLQACKEVVYFDAEGERPALVLNCVLEAGCDSLLIQLTQTKAAYDQSPWQTFPDADVRVYENGELSGRAVWDGDGHFVLRHRVEPEHTYRISAEVPGKGTVWGETTVPERLQECTLEQWGEAKYANRHYKTECRWRDTPGRDNYYWISARNSGFPRVLSNVGTDDIDTLHWEKFFNMRTESTLPDPFNRWVLIGEGDQGNDVFYEEYIRIADTGRDGNLLELTCTYHDFGNWSIFSLKSADRHLDAYLRSVIEIYRDDSLAEESPWLFHPSYVYTNIHGGTGLVASYTPTENFLRLPPNFSGAYGPGITY